MRFFFQNGVMPINFNLVHVCLIPKTNSLDRVEQFRPIALANFQNNIISKILVKRLAPIAASIVFSQQSAFITKMSIVDGIITTLECINVFRPKGI